ncbi:MAG: molybdopterin molybdotransferase MoeA [Desulfuromonadales bacterium]|nr:molybdopterin molybdotransferase MoeA [Desulfuromonadales bacterium]
MGLAFEEARTLILENITALGVERVHLLNAAGRVLAEDVAAPWDLPRWDNSAMDGYAVRAADCHGPHALRVTGYLPAGGRADGLEVTAGTAVKIMTGAPIPVGCDAVVPVEETEAAGDEVLIKAAVATGDHIRFHGEDVRVGSLAVPAGTVLGPPEINMLATFSQVFVTVIRRPRVAILSTGDELVELGDTAGAGQIVNSNSLSLAIAVQEAGGEPLLLGIARDNVASLREKLAQGLTADALITSAGVSAGDCDLVRDVLAELGVQQLFWKIDIKPGRPTAFGLKGKTPVFSLPGNPVSTMVTFENFVRPALLKMMGRRHVLRPLLRATLREPAQKKPGRVHFMRVTVTVEDGRLSVASSGDQNTGILQTMLRANAIAILPADRASFEAGEEVMVQLLDTPAL